MQNLLLINGLVLLSACATGEAPAPPIAGSYRGRLYIASAYPAQGAYSQRIVDTTMLVATTDNTTFFLFDRQLAASVSAHDWLGHKPARSHYSFEAGFGYSNGILLQKEQAGDSIYVDYRKGGASAGIYYRFYAKRQ